MHLISERFWFCLYYKCFSYLSWMAPALIFLTSVYNRIFVFKAGFLACCYDLKRNSLEDPNLKCRQKLSNQNDMKLAGYSFRLNNYVKIPPPPHFFRIFQSWRRHSSRSTNLSFLLTQYCSHLQEARHCLQDHTWHIKEENRALRKELLGLIQQTRVLYQHKKQLEEQHKVLLREKDYANNLQDQRNKRQERLYQTFGLKNDGEGWFCLES